MNPAILGLGFVVATFAALAIDHVLHSGGRQVAARIERLADDPRGGRSRPAGGREVGMSSLRQQARHLAQKVEPLLYFLDPRRSLDRALWQAQIAWTPAEFGLAALVLGLACAAVGWQLLPRPLGLAAGVSAALPFWLLGRRAGRMRKLLIGQLPDALLLVVNAVRAGHGLFSALRIVSSQVPAPAGTEFGVVLSEINLGLSVDQAFMNLADRTDLVDVDLAVGAILVQRETGSNLAEILTHIQDTLRDRARIAGEVHALTAQGRLSGWVLALLPIGVGALFSLVNPAYLQPFLADPRGRAMLMAIAALQIVGILVIRKVVDVKY